MELQGHSGCKLYIEDLDGCKVVKKISADISYNSRLIKQMQKQCRQRLDGFEECKVYSEGYEDGLFSFVMEYVNGTTFADKISCISLCEIDHYVDMLIRNYKEFQEINAEAKRIFDKKIHEVYKSIKDSRSIASEYQTRLLQSFDSIMGYSWKYVIKSECHGDMTFENIMVKNMRLYLIDYLDSFYDSWMIDAAKLLQDADLMWSYRNKSKDSNLIVRLTVFRDTLIDKILSMFEGENILDTIYHILLLNTLRICPYSYNEEDIDFLIKSIDRINKKIRMREWKD